MADEYIIELGKALYDPDTGAAVFKPEFREKLIRCRDCKYWNAEHMYCECIGNWFGIVGEWSENGFCYKAERRE